MKKKETADIPEIVLSYKNKVRPADRVIVPNAQAAATIFLKSWNKDTLDLQEEFKAMLLASNGGLLGIYTPSKGGITSTTVDPRLIFAAALGAGTASMIIAHNHPSGAVEPSDADKTLTSKLKSGASLLDIQLLDHLILTRDNYYSFAQTGNL